MRLSSGRRAWLTAALSLLVLCSAHLQTTTAQVRATQNGVAVDTMVDSRMDLPDVSAQQHREQLSVPPSLLPHERLKAAPLATGVTDSTQLNSKSAPVPQHQGSDDAQHKLHGAASASQLDSQLLHELDRLIALHQQKVDVLLRMRQDIGHNTATLTGRLADDAAHRLPSSPTSTGDTASPATTPYASDAHATPPRHTKQRPSSGSSSREPFSLSAAVPQLVQRAAMFLAAIAVLVVYQYVQHKRAQQPNRDNTTKTSNTSRAWEDEWTARTRRLQLLEHKQKQQQQLDVAGLRRRRPVVGGEVAGVEDEGKELYVESEVYEQRDGGVEWGEAEGDYWDASVSRHDGYAGVLGVEDDGKDADEEEEKAATSGGGIVMDGSDDDEDEYEDELEDELPDEDDQG